MTPEEQVQSIIATAEENPESEQSIYRAALTSRGVSLNEAQDSYRFVQIALARYLMKDMGITFSPDYWRFSEKGEHLTTDQLQNSPVFRAAESRATSSFSKSVISALAYTSPEFGAVNDLLKSGSKASDLALAPVVLFEGNPNDKAIQKAGEQMRQFLSDIPKPTQSKPWWKIW